MLCSDQPGVDAGVPDTGVVCMGDCRGRQVLGMRLTSKETVRSPRPIATVLGSGISRFPTRLGVKKIVLPVC